MILLPKPEIFWDHFHKGDCYRYEGYRVSNEEIIEFGQKHDPLPHHTDPELAARSNIGVLCASGIHAMGIAQKLSCDGLFLRSALIAGRGVENMRMHRPIIDGDELTLELLVSEHFIHKYAADRGWVVFEGKLLDINEEIAMSYRTAILFLKSSA